MKIELEGATLGFHTSEMDRAKIEKLIRRDIPKFYHKILLESLNTGRFYKFMEPDEDLHDVEAVENSIMVMGEELGIPDDGMTTTAYIRSDGAIVCGRDEKDLYHYVKLLFDGELNFLENKYAFIDESVYTVEAAIKDVDNPTDEMKVACFEFLRKRIM